MRLPREGDGPAPRVGAQAAAPLARRQRDTHGPGPGGTPPVPGQLPSRDRGQTGTARPPVDGAPTAGQPAGLEGMARSRGPDGAQHGSALT